MRYEWRTVGIHLNSLGNAHGRHNYAGDLDAADRLAAAHQDSTVNVCNSEEDHLQRKKIQKDVASFGWVRRAEEISLLLENKIAIATTFSLN